MIKVATNFADGGVTRLRDASAGKVTRKFLECKVGLRRRQDKKPPRRGFIRIGGRERERRKRERKGGRRGRKKEITTQS